jgi:hypothetical protein
LSYPPGTAKVTVTVTAGTFDAERRTVEIEKKEGTP